jgi:hypothetical protein
LYTLTCLQSLFAPNLSYNGPEQVVVSSVGLATIVAGGVGKCVCVVEVRGEEEMVPISYSLADVPTKIEMGA